MEIKTTGDNYFSQQLRELWAEVKRMRIKSVIGGKLEQRSDGSTLICDGRANKGSGKTNTDIARWL